MSSTNPSTFSQRQIARLFGVTTRTIQRWEEEGLAEARTGEGATYDAAAAVEWYGRWKEERARSDMESTDIDEAKARREKARARLAEIEVAKEEGRLVPQEVVDEIYGGRLLDVLRSAILNMPGRWGAQITGLDNPRQGEAVLKRVASELLEHFSGSAADEMESDGTPALPADLPGRDHLEAAGVATVSDLLSVSDLTAIEGIGPATARKIAAYIEGGEGVA